jgi:hypothetical protein
MGRAVHNREDQGNLMNAEELRHALREALLKEAEKAEKPRWRPMLRYLAELHARCIHPPMAHFPHPFEEIGTGYNRSGMGFGHIDLTHARLDSVHAFPEHSRLQLLNELAGQQEDGLIVGVIYFREGEPRYSRDKGFPAVWPVSVEAYIESSSDESILPVCLDALVKQIGWFERKRSAPDAGFYYLDVLQDTWESGSDEGVRYDVRPDGPAASVDATAHLYLMYDHAARWSRKLNRPAGQFEKKAAALRSLIQERLFDPETGRFYDSWVVDKPELQHQNHEAIWPMVVGAASEEQANRMIDEHLLNPKEHFTPHPISTVGINDPKFELRMWRGPVWNCMTYWAARGCARYGRKDAARKLMEAALDATAEQFEKTGTLWEFYHPFKGEQMELLRKPDRGWMTPCRDYVGHNPLFAMTDLWRRS